MKQPLSIAILGAGAIANHVISQIRDQSDFKISAIIARESSIKKAEQLAGQFCPIIIHSDQLPADVDLVADCAGHSGLIAHGANILSKGIDLITLSNGALANEETHLELAQAANRGKSHLKLLSGAIGGIDVLSAAKTGEITSVLYTGRKPPSGWAGTRAEEKCNLQTLSIPFTHFKGSARDAAIMYPKNANVAASIALAGIGMDETRVELIADPDISMNTHEIRASGVFGEMQLKIAGHPLPDNPKSSALAAMSIVQELYRRVSEVGF